MTVAEPSPSGIRAGERPEDLARQAAFGHLAALIGSSEQDLSLLAGYADRTGRWVDEFLVTYYDAFYGYETEAQGLEGGDADRDRAVRRWYLSLVSGRVSEAFWQRQFVVGLVNFRHRVSGTFAVAVGSRTQQFFFAQCLKEFEPAEAVALYSAFKRITDLVVGLMSEGHHLGFIGSIEKMTGMSSRLLDRIAEIAVRRIQEG